MFNRKSCYPRIIINAFYWISWSHRLFIKHKIFKIFISRIHFWKQ